MSERVSPSLYPEREAYPFPTTRDEQIWETVNLYDSREEAVWFLYGLHNMYKGEQYIKAMALCSDIASEVRASITPTIQSTDLSFYQGVLFSTHVNLWPINQTDQAKRMLNHFPYEEEKHKDALRSTVLGWIDEPPEKYLESIEDLGLSLQAGIALFSERLYPVDVESRADFLAGFCLSTRTIDYYMPKA